jgi:quinohemoprotein ethanol dehydrogenase
MVFKLDGSEVALPPELPTPDPRPAGTQVVFLDEQAMRGKATYVVRCGACHGWFGQTGLLPDLRRTSDETLANLESILLDGAYVELGMPSFADQLNSGDIDDLRAYLRAVSRP